MEELTLQFVIMIDGPAGVTELIEHIARTFPDSVGVKQHSCDLRHNWIEVWENVDADPMYATGEGDAFLHYPYELQATPMESVTEDQQGRLARELTSIMRARNWKARVCANFEGKL